MSHYFQRPGVPQPQQAALSPAQRMQICAVCPQQQLTKFGPRCNICGCFLMVKTKMPSEHCPLQKW